MEWEEMDSYVEYHDGSTEVYRAGMEGKESQHHIQVHAYVEMWDDRCEPFKLTLDQAEAFHHALEEVLAEIDAMTDTAEVDG